MAKNSLDAAANEAQAPLASPKTERNPKMTPKLSMMDNPRRQMMDREPHSGAL
jgi:hypothetical protein